MADWSNMSDEEFERIQDGMRKAYGEPVEAEDFLRPDGQEYESACGHQICTDIGRAYEALGLSHFHSMRKVVSVAVKWNSARSIATAEASNEFMMTAMDYDLFEPGTSHRNS